MSQHLRILRRLATLTLLALAASAAAAQPPAGPIVIEDGDFRFVFKGGGEVEELDADIFLEFDEDGEEAELVIEAEADIDDGEVGLKKLVVLDPRGRVSARATGRAHGFAGIELESPEPGLAALLRAFPEGEYMFLATTRGGEEFAGVAELSHESPDAPEILSPEEDAVIPAGAPLTISWEEVDGADEYIVEVTVEQEDDGEEDGFEAEWEVEVPANLTSITVPAEILVAGAAVEIEVGVEDEETENVAFSEIEISTEE